MSILDILIIPDKRLKYKSSKVFNFDNDLKNTVKDLFDTLYDSGNGIGLAAPQVGITKQIVVIDLKEDGEKRPRIFINPRIIKFSETKAVNEEGCLSIPGYYGDVERYKTIEVEWFDMNGEINRGEFNGLLSICIQHEIDHLNGILFVDYLSSLKKRRAYEKVKKNIKKNNERVESS